MIKLFGVKEKQALAKESGNIVGKDATGQDKGKLGGRSKQTPGELRIQKDISELTLAKTMKMRFPEGKDKLLNFEMVLSPDEGYYRGGEFLFQFNISPNYPHDAPKVKCKTKVYHPNIDVDGNICLNILREDWKPVLSISAVIYGLQFLFLDPNPDDPLNTEAAEVLRDNPKLFATNVRRSIQYSKII